MQGRLGGEGSFVNQILQTHGIKNPQPSKGYAKKKWKDELPVALTYDLHDVPDICHMFRCLHKHSSKAAVDELKPIMAELAELPGNKMVQMITRYAFANSTRFTVQPPAHMLLWVSLHLCVTLLQDS